MKLMIVGLTVVLGAAGLTWFAAPQVLALIGPLTDTSWTRPLAFATAGLALTGAVVLLTWPQRRRAAATALPPSAPVASNDPEPAVSEPVTGTRLIFLVERESLINSPRRDRV